MSHCTACCSQKHAVGWMSQTVYWVTRLDFGNDSKLNGSFCGLACLKGYSRFAITLLKIKVLYWHQWFHEKHLTSIEPYIPFVFLVFFLHSIKFFIKCKSVLHTKKMALLRTDHWKVLWGTQNSSSMALLWKPPFGVKLKLKCIISVVLCSTSIFFSWSSS